ncbi:MAG: carboxypeptidase regulatory-like domain-containing protein [Flavobacteriales bacterium]|nr:carboxypeptidase regulatory-like domain-containing protein [Flavobacteriales bacterium]
MKNLYSKGEVRFVRFKKSLALFLIIFGLNISGFSQNADLQIQLTSVTTLCPGESFTYTYTISNNGPNSANGATFNDNFPSGLTQTSYSSCNATGGAVCPSSYTISNTNFSGTIPTLPSGGQVIMNITMEAPSPPYNSSFSNTATVSPPSGTTDPNMSTNSSTWNITLRRNIDIAIEGSMDTFHANCNGFPDTSFHMVRFINKGSCRADSVLLNIYVPFGSFTRTGIGSVQINASVKMIDTVWNISPGTSMYNTQLYNSSITYSVNLTGSSSGYGNYNYIQRRVKRWESGDTVELTFKVVLESLNLNGCGYTLSGTRLGGHYATFAIPSNTTLTDTFSTNNSLNWSYGNSFGPCSGISCPTTDIEAFGNQSTFNAGCGDLPDTSYHTVGFVNHGPANADSTLLSVYIPMGGFTKTGNGTATISVPFVAGDTSFYTSSGTTLYPTSYFNPGGTYSLTLSTASSGTSNYNFLQRRVKKWEPGDTVLISYRIIINGLNHSGCGYSITGTNVGGTNTSFTIPTNLTLTDTFSANNFVSINGNDVGPCTAAACPVTDIEVVGSQTTFNAACQSGPDTSYHTVYYVNHGPSTADSVLLTYFLPFGTWVKSGSGTAVITNNMRIIDTVWSVGAGSSLYETSFYNSNLYYSTTLSASFAGYSNYSLIQRRVKNWAVGDTIKVQYAIEVGKINLSGCGFTVSSSRYGGTNANFIIPSNMYLKDTFSGNDAANISGNTGGPWSRLDVSISKSVSPAILISGDTLTMSYQFQNASGGVNAIEKTFIDTLPQNFFINLSTFSCSASSGASCGSYTYDTVKRIFTYTAASLPSSGLINISFKGAVFSQYDETTTTRAYAPQCEDCIPSTNFTETNYQINANPYLGDYVWLDLNKDGDQDANEPAMSGIEVTLFNSSDNLLGTTKTDANGRYRFGDLTSGTYYVQFHLPPNYKFTSQTTGTSFGSDANPTTGKTPNVSISTNNHLDLDAGLIPAENSVGSIGDYVWFDENSNGIQDYSEKGFSGVLVTLYDNSGNKLMNTYTDKNGMYLFNNLDAGTYVVGMNPVPGFIASTANVGDDAFDSDINTTSLKTSNIVLTSGQNIRHIDAGLVRQPASSASLGNFVWYDLNNDWIQSGGNEKGVEDIKVVLKNSSGSRLDSLFTSFDGQYVFNNLNAGGYILEFSNLPSGYNLVHPYLGFNNTVDSDPNQNLGNTDTIILSAGEINMSIDAGINDTTNTNTASLGDFVWYDYDQDGIQDSNEAGVAGVTVILYNTSDIEQDRTTTDRNGWYKFINLAAGTYYIQFSNIPPNHQFTGTGSGTPSTDNNANASGRTANITINAGTHTTDVDAGIIGNVIDVLPASLGNRVWYDLNNNGLQDNGEPGVPGVRVRLLDNTGNTVIDSTTTSGLGYYIFNELAAEDYFIQVVSSTLPSGYTFVTQNAGSDDKVDSDVNTSTGKTSVIALEEGEDDMSHDAGIYKANVASLGNYVWFDIDQDGYQDADEPGAPGVTAKLYNTSNTLIQTTSTDENGKYLFTNLSAGTYYVVFVNAPAGYVFTSQSSGTDSSAANQLGKTGNISLSTGQTYLDLDAGLTSSTVGLLSGRFWFDQNKNGIEESSENPVPGQTILLLNDSEEPISAAVTNENGEYEFAGLQSGIYYTSFINTISNTQFTTQTTNTSNGSDVNPITGLSASIFLPVGGNVPDNDGGIIDFIPAKLGNIVWIDNDNDGIQNGTFYNVGGVGVQLYNLNDELISSTATTANGEYMFDKLPAGDYYIKFSRNTLPSGYSIVANNVGSNDSEDSDADPTTGNTSTISLSEGEVDMSWDMGITLNPSNGWKIGGIVWADPDLDGLQEGKEGRIANTKVMLYTTTGTLVTCGTTASKNLRDDFNVGSFSNNDGNTNFSSNWIEIGESNGPSVLGTRITGGNLYHQQLNPGESRSIERQFSLKEASGTVSITFNYYFFKSSTGTFAASVEYFNNGSWVNMVSATGTLSATYTGTLPKTATAVRFSYTSNNSASYARLNYIEISYNTVPIPVQILTNSQGEYEFDSDIFYCLNSNSTYHLRVNLADTTLQSQSASATNATGKTDNSAVTDFGDSDGSTSIASGFSTIVITTPTSGQNMFLDFGFGVNNPVPVELLKFEAKWVKTDALLTWSTASEINNRYFVVERSIDGIDNFQPIGIVNSLALNGNSDQILAYSFIDQNVETIITKSVFYRLRQIDFNGDEEIHPLRVLTKKSEEIIQIYPNPTNGLISIDLTDSETSNVFIRITDNLGRVMFESDYMAVPEIINYSFEGLSAGVYFMTIKTNNGIQVEKIIYNHD